MSATALTNHASLFKTSYRYASITQKPNIQKHFNIMRIQKLNAYAANVTSQHGEDGIIQFILDNMSGTPIRIACEVGAWDGRFASNIYSLWHNQGWKAVLIEADVAKYVELQKNVVGKDVVCLHRSISAAGENSLDRIFATGALPKDLGILSVDIDSFDYHVWRGLSVLKPQIAIIEHNQNIPPHIDYFDPEGNVYLKCSAKALERVGVDKGYRLICCTQTNSIFIRNDLFNADKFPDMPVEWLFDYSELKPQVIFTGEQGNMFPVFSKRTRTALKWWLRIYYRFSALPKSKRRFNKPPRRLVGHLRSQGLDV